MIRIRVRAGPTSRPLGDHVGAELERRGLGQANLGPEYMGQGCLIYHDCLDFAGKAAFDFGLRPNR
eukprot:4501750-Alexandrium_andersonii.AAC.1